MSVGRFGWLVWGALVGCAPTSPAERPARASADATIQPAPPPALAPTDERRPPSEVDQLVKQLRANERIENPRERWEKRRQTIEKIRELGDPRGANPLVAYLDESSKLSRPSERVHVRTQIAMALAELGDLRAIPVLAERLGLDPLTLYAETIEVESVLRITDQERIESARLIADLAELHSDQQARIREQAEQAIWTWTSSLPEPHANGLRALARMKSENPSIREQIRKWADPITPLPKPGQQPPFPSEFAVAQSALRYLGALGDERGFSIFEKQLQRRPKNFDGTNDGLLKGGAALLGMSLRALAVGASEGLSELGDRKAFSSLSKLISDDKSNEQARVAACTALVWVASDADAKEIAKRIETWRGAKDAAAAFRLSCLLQALSERPLAASLPAVRALLDSGSASGEIRVLAAAVLGRAGLEPADETKLSGELDDATRGTSAAIALLLGGSPEAAKRVVEKHPKPDDVVMRTARVLSTVSSEDLKRGRLFRWVRNALAAGDAWPRQMLLEQLAMQNRYDRGPHSLTRFVLRRRLFDLARGANPDEKKMARETLEIMDERGTLAALEAQ